MRKLRWKRVLCVLGLAFVLIPCVGATWAPAPAQPAEGSSSSCRQWVVLPSPGPSQDFTIIAAQGQGQTGLRYGYGGIECVDGPGNCGGQTY